MIANKPPMGWNSWNTFECNINEQLIMEIADNMEKQGFLEAGYNYIVIDDIWSLRERNREGRLVADPQKFPNGMKYIGDYLHKKGFKFGMYSCAGIQTCAGYPGSFGYEYIDAQTFAEWGVDFLKYDFCFFPENGDYKNAYLTMSMALRSTGRDIVFSACNWGNNEPWKWMRSIGAHMYRSTQDIFDSYKSFTDIWNSQRDNFSMSAPYCFNDMDMLVAGMYGKGHVGIESGCTDNEYKMHFAIWSLFGCPLIIGADVRNLSDYVKELLLNKELIRINQDVEARPPYPLEATAFWGFDKTPVFMKILSGNEYVFAVFNTTEETFPAKIMFELAGVPANSGYCFELFDVFSGENLGLKKDFYNVAVAAHDCIVLKGKLIKS